MSHYSESIMNSRDHGKFKQSLSRRWLVPGGWDSQISRQSAHEGRKFVSPAYGP